jgi:hypothetical protein
MKDTYLFLPPEEEASAREPVLVEASPGEAYYFANRHPRWRVFMESTIDSIRQARVNEIKLDLAEK